MVSETLKINKNGELLYITFPKIAELGITNHAFSTRRGGVSEGFLSSMNMSFSRG